ncbi:hypothetical protein PLESTM_001011200 [Pleodorina starrii]|nr:hypothetical protein PLESTM_001011200 [Pleodorina starrii]
MCHPETCLFSKGVSLEEGLRLDWLLRRRAAAVPWRRRWSDATRRRTCATRGTSCSTYDRALRPVLTVRQLTRLGMSYKDDLLYGDDELMLSGSAAAAADATGPPGVVLEALGAEPEEELMDETGGGCCLSSGGDRHGDKPALPLLECAEDVSYLSRQALLELLLNSAEGEHDEVCVTPSDIDRMPSEPAIK